MLPHHISSYVSIKKRTQRRLRTIQASERKESGMSETSTGGHHNPERYEIRLKGHLDLRWATWFDGLSLTNENDGTTIIHGLVADQAALHGLLQRVRDIGLPRVSVTRIEPDQPDEPSAPR
jgi:hypothetical protein